MSSACSSFRSAPVRLLSCLRLLRRAQTICGAHPRPAQSLAADEAAHQSRPTQPVRRQLPRFLRRVFCSWAHRPAYRATFPPGSAAD